MTARFDVSILRRFAAMACAATAALSLGSAAHAQGLSVNFTSIADSTNPIFQDSFGDAPAINESGTVAFQAGRGVFRCNGGAVTTIADAATQGFTFIGGNPSINDSGTVAFTVGLAGRRGGIFTGDGGALTTVAALGGTRGFTGFGAASINDSGTVAFLGASGPQLNRTEGLFIGPNGAATIALSTPGLGGNGLGDPTLNNSGTVAFFGHPDGVTSNNGVFTGNGGPLTTIVDTNADPSFVDFEHPSLNDAGSLAFLAFDINVGDEILFSQPGSASPSLVLKDGDTLFGSTVTSLFVGRYALNESNQIAFSYTLEDGRSGVAVANLATSAAAAPEPGSFLLLLSVLLPLGMLRRR